MHAFNLKLYIATLLKLCFGVNVIAFYTSHNLHNCRVLHVNYVINVNHYQLELCVHREPYTIKFAVLWCFYKDANFACSVIPLSYCLLMFLKLRFKCDKINVHLHNLQWIMFSVCVFLCLTNTNILIARTQQILWMWL